MNNHIYPEVVGYRSRGERVPPPVFPDACPSCGAPSIGTEPDTISRPQQAYGCGGKYISKPQIQNHTDYWWGYCPVASEAVRH